MLGSPPVVTEVALAENNKPDQLIGLLYNPSIGDFQKHIEFCEQFGQTILVLPEQTYNPHIDLLIVADYGEILPKKAAEYCSPKYRQMAYSAYFDYFVENTLYQYAANSKVVFFGTAHAFASALYKFELKEDVYDRKGFVEIEAKWQEKLKLEANNFYTYQRSSYVPSSQGAGVIQVGAYKANPCCWIHHTDYVAGVLCDPTEVNHRVNSKIEAIYKYRLGDILSCAIVNYILSLQHG